MAREKTNGSFFHKCPLRNKRGCETISNMFMRLDFFLRLIRQEEEEGSNLSLAISTFTLRDVAEPESMENKTGLMHEEQGAAETNLENSKSSNIFKSPHITNPCICNYHLPVSLTRSIFLFKKFPLLYGFFHGCC